MKTEKKFYWNEETLSHFRFEANYTSKKNVIKNISAFVENECDLENDENDEDLIKDLINQVFNQKNTKK